MKTIVGSLLVVLCIAPPVRGADAFVPEKIRPADPDLTAEARAVLDYLRSVYGKKVIAGLNNEKNVDDVRRASGKEPAIVSFDLSGWNSPTWGETYNKAVQISLDMAKGWHKGGGIVALQVHWIHPGNPDGSAWLQAHGRKPASKPFNLAAACQSGTPEHQQVMRDLKGHADFLQQLADARIPVLWRPLHEIEGGWFWWTDPEKPENTAALWRMMFEYFTKDRKLHNLIWVYSSALRCGKGEAGVENVEMRKRFYPGDAYVDIVGIDVYPSPFIKIGPPQQDTYLRSYGVMQQIAPSKMIALAECEAIPNPDKMAKDGPKWLYCLPWWGEGTKHPAAWMKITYTHPLLVTKDQLFGRTSPGR